jgi:hypothetical protein
MPLSSSNLLYQLQTEHYSLAISRHDFALFTPYIDSFTTHAGHKRPHAHYLILIHHDDAYNKNTRFQFRDDNQIRKTFDIPFTITPICTVNGQNRPN